MSKENMKAFLIGRMPCKADKSKDLKELLTLIPSLKADPSKRAERRALSELARITLPAWLQALNVHGVISTPKTVRKRFC